MRRTQTKHQPKTRGRADKQADVAHGTASHAGALELVRNARARGRLTDEQALAKALRHVVAAQRSK